MLHGQSCGLQTGSIQKQQSRDNVEMVSTACPSEFRIPYDYGRRCCVKDFKDDEPGLECQDVTNPTLEYQDHADCCADSTKCPKDNGICEKNESGTYIQNHIC